MSIPTEVIMRMATLGLSEEQAKAVADMLTTVETATAETVAASYEERIEDSREKGRERWRKWKSTHPTNVSKRVQTLANDSKQLVGGDAPVEDNTLTSVIEPQKKENIEDAFAGVLSPELAREVVAHRKALKKQLTPYGAKLLAKQIASCPDPIAAAEAMIANGWQGVKPSYMQDRNQVRGSPPAPSLADVFAHAGTRAANHENQPEPSEDRSRLRAVVQNLPTVRAG